MNNVLFRYNTYATIFDGIMRHSYPYNIGISFHNDILQNPKYLISNRDLPETNTSFQVSNIQYEARNILYILWATTLQRGNLLFTLCDHKKRYLFDVLWSQWKERWKKARGGVHDVIMDMRSAFPWTPPTFAFYPFVAANASGLGCHSFDTACTLTAGAGGSLSSQCLILTEQADATYAARNVSLSWFQQKDNSSISLLAQFRVGEIASGAEIDIINISDGSNKIRLYALYSEESSSSVSSSSSATVSSLSSSSLSSTSESSSSQTASSSSTVSVSSSSSQSQSSSSTDMSQTASSESTSSSQSSSSSSLGNSSSSSSLGKSSSSSLGRSSSSSEGRSSSSSLGRSSSSSSLVFSSSSLSSSNTESYSSYSSASTSSASSLSSSSSQSSSVSGSSESSSGEGTNELTIGLEWTKSGQAAESISVDAINAESNSSPAWYDICGTFDNINNQFHLYICRRGDTSVQWSYTMDFLYGTASLTAVAENCLVSDTSPTNYPEDVTWTQLYLLKGNQAEIYADNDKKAELKYAMIIDEFIPPTEFNWLRRLFHYWTKSGATFPK